MSTDVEVRSYNGRCEYGDWLAVRDEDVPEWVGDLIADEIAEHDAFVGVVSQGGCAYRWRKGE